MQILKTRADKIVLIVFYTNYVVIFFHSKLFFRVFLETKAVPIEKPLHTTRLRYDHIRVPRYLPLQKMKEVASSVTFGRETFTMINESGKLPKGIPKGNCSASLVRGDYKVHRTIYL